MVLGIGPEPQIVPGFKSSSVNVPQYTWRRPSEHLLAHSTKSSSSRQHENALREPEDGLSGRGTSTTSDRMSRPLDIASPIRRAVDHLVERGALAEVPQTRKKAEQKG